MTTHTTEAEITKSARGWSVHTVQNWQGERPMTAHTHKGASTLRWAIFDVAHWAARNDTAVIRLSVNGQPYPYEKIVDAIRKIDIDYAVEPAIAACDSLKEAS